MPNSYVHCCVTSPPYWNLRDYGCNGQIGLEQTPEEYVTRIVEVFREVRRVLRDDGTLWLNLGDTYAANRKKQVPDSKGGASATRSSGIGTSTPNNLKPKDLVGIPWRVAFALQADGWWLRQDIIWHKPNPMPESVKNRCTKAHEYLFLLSKSSDYHCDMDAIAEPSMGWHNSKFHTGKTNEHQLNRTGKKDRNEAKTRNRRSVWSVATKPYKKAHFATFPPKLIKPCIIAGCPENGIVLDPFAGSGTTAEVANTNNRRAILIELNPNYIKFAHARVKQAEVDKGFGFLE